MNYKRIILTFLISFLVAGLSIGHAAIKKGAKKGKNDEILRDYTGFYDLQQNTISNLDFWTTNYGIFGLDVARGRGGGFWPRGSQNQYIFGGGIWFAAKRQISETDTTVKKYVEVSYNPNNGRSWMVPGHIGFDESDEADDSDILKYRTYFSTDFGSDGVAFNSDEKPNWPIWDYDDDRVLKVDRYFGTYVNDANDRNATKYKKGPAFISQEDIFCVFKDTDLSKFDGGKGRRQNEGYPLRLQFEEMIYSWGFGKYKDFIFIKYDIINYSEDTLKDCWMAPVMDIDIARRANSQAGASNDRTRFYDEDSTLNLAFQWTNPDRGERGYGFGYLGFDFLESPAVYRFYDTTFKDSVIQDENGNPKDTTFVIVYEVIKPDTRFIRKDSAFYANSSQIGLQTFRNWPIEEDIQDDEPRYDFMASKVRDGDFGAGDKRFMMATGPFHMRPGDTSRVVVGMMIANAASRLETDGSTEDVAGLVELDKFAQKVYDNNFKAPTPPTFAKFLPYGPYNNAIKISWDTTSEYTTDPEEKGLDFMGYRLYRARRSNLDTFSLDNIQYSDEYNKGSGPLGWKQIAQWQIPTPFQKSVRKPSDNPDDDLMPNIDSLKITGYQKDNSPVYQPFGGYDPWVVNVIRLGQGVSIMPDSLALVRSQDWFGDRSVAPIIARIDTSFFSQPWGKYYSKFLADSLALPTNRGESNYLLDEVMAGKVHLNRSLVQYNPTFYKKITQIISPTETALIKSIKDSLDSGMVEMFIIDSMDVGGDMVQYIDSVYLLSTFQYGQYDYDGTAKNGYKLDIFIKRNDISNIMREEETISEALDSLYTYIQDDKIEKVEFPEFESSTDALENVILPYFKNAINDRTYVDIGDDNRNGIIDVDEDPAKTERILNNIDYFYKILSYDEGDWTQPTPSKLNSGNVGLPNVQLAYAQAAPVTKKIKFEVLPYDTSALGGFYNFEFFATNIDRIQQQYAGHIFKLEVIPYWALSQFRICDFTKDVEVPLLWRALRITDTTTGKLIYSSVTNLETTPCYYTPYGGFTENAASWVMCDQVVPDSISGEDITFGTRNSYETKIRSGHFTSGDFNQVGYCYSYGFVPEATGIFGFSFDYTLLQDGGVIRPDSTTPTMAISGDAVTPIKFIDNDDEILRTQIVDTTFLYRTFDRWIPQNVIGGFQNGPVNLEVTFKNLKQEQLTLNYGKTYGNQKKFNVKYLEVDVRDVISYNRPVTPKSSDSVNVAYNDTWEPIEYTVSDLNDKYISALCLRPETDKSIRKYNLRSYGFVNGRRENGITAIKKQQSEDANGEFNHNVIKFPTIGTQNRYYLTGISEDGLDTVDFVNMISVNGIQFAFDYANKARGYNYINQWGESQYSVPPEEYVYGQDFEPGDKVMLKTFGGVLGVPLPSAKVLCRISEATNPEEGYTDDILDNIKVVPNPYYISHIGQKSPYDGKLYFTKLPPRCTIQIYTINGDLIKTLEHDTYSDPDVDKAYIDIWNLLSENKQRVESQTMVALITTPDGAQTIKRFSVVVGGFRIIQE